MLRFDRRRKLSDSQAPPLDVSNINRDSIKFTVAIIKAEKNGSVSYPNYTLAKVSGKEFVRLFKAKQNNQDSPTPFNLTSTRTVR